MVPPLTVDLDDGTGGGGRFTNANHRCQRWTIPETNGIMQSEIVDVVSGKTTIPER